MGDVDADPLPAELLRGMDGGAAAAEGIEHDIALVRRGGDDPLEQGERLLGRIAEAFLGCGLLIGGISSQTFWTGSPWHLVQIALEPGIPPAAGECEPALLRRAAPYVSRE